MCAPGPVGSWMPPHLRDRDAFEEFLTSEPAPRHASKPRPWEPPPSLPWHLRHPHWTAAIWAAVVAGTIVLLMWLMGNQ